MSKKKITIISVIIVLVIIVLIMEISNQNNKHHNDAENNINTDANAGKFYEKSEEKFNLYELYSSDGEVIGTYPTKEDLETAKEFYKENPDYRANPPKSPDAENIEYQY